MGRRDVKNSKTEPFLGNYRSARPTILLDPPADIPPAVMQGITDEEFAGKLLGRDSAGGLLLGGEKLP